MDSEFIIFIIITWSIIDLFIFNVKVCEYIKDNFEHGWQGLTVGQTITFLLSLPTLIIMLCVYFIMFIVSNIIKVMKKLSLIDKIKSIWNKKII
jgi:hypothetical protein